MNLTEKIIELEKQLKTEQNKVKELEMKILDLEYNAPEAQAKRLFEKRNPK